MNGKTADMHDEKAAKPKNKQNDRNNQIHEGTFLVLGISQILNTSSMSFFSEGSLLESSEHRTRPIKVVYRYQLFSSSNGRD